MEATVPAGNISRSSTQRRIAKVPTRTHRSLSFIPERFYRSSGNRNEHVSSMTVEFLKARLIAERSTAESAKLKIEELENKVVHLERSLELEIEKRQNAEAALQESLEKMLDYTASGGEASTDTELESFVTFEGGRNSGLVKQPGFDDLVALLKEEPTPTTGSVQVPKDEPAESIRVQPTVHSDSDWATDNANGTKHEENTESEEEDFEHNSRLLGVPGKMGSFLQSHRKSSKKEGGDEVSSQAKEPWFSKVVRLIEDEIPDDSSDMPGIPHDSSDMPEIPHDRSDMLEIPHDRSDMPEIQHDSMVEETHQSTQVQEPEVPYVSFVKYLGLSEPKNVEKFIETDGEGTIWKIHEVHADVEGNKTDSVAPESKLQEPESIHAMDDVKTAEFHRKNLKDKLVKLGVIKTEDHTICTELADDRMDDLFKVINSAKKKLKHSRERRETIEKQLLGAR